MEESVGENERQKRLPDERQEMTSAGRVNSTFPLYARVGSALQSYRDWEHMFCLLYSSL